MKIKVREITEGCKFKVIDSGDWIDLYAAEDVKLIAPQAGVQYENRLTGQKFRDVSFNLTFIPLGIAMALPKGYEAYIVPRSSTFKNFKVIQANSFGIVDFCYSGDNDEWKLPVIPLDKTEIKKGTRICQFRIQLSQKATFWQKLKWLFSSKIEFEWVDHLNNTDRGGFGSTGV